MASTRNKNTRGDYILEQKQNRDMREYTTYIDSVQAETTFFAGNGLLPGRVAATNLAFNSVEIESQLYGIGATNLVEPMATRAIDPKPMKSLNISDRLTTYVPPDFVVEGGQRPYPLR
jgi:hypothetical protein